MYILLMVRYDKGQRHVIPFMLDEDDVDMKIFDTRERALEMCRTHILAKSSENIILDIETGETEYL